MSMLLPPTNSLRVAVLGSGIAGSAAARALAERGVQVTVFEAGFGIGGRTSTRITRDDFHYQFDHGGQYIGKPKTDVFRNVLDEWKAKGWVSPWNKGRFLLVDGQQQQQQQQQHQVREEEPKERYVGTPGMHSICHNLLEHENIRVQLQTRANASRNPNANEKSSEGANQQQQQQQGPYNWQLKNGKTQEDLGSFDWLIASDRISGSHYRKDLALAGEDVTKGFRSNLRKIKSVQCLTAMVVFESPLVLPTSSSSKKDDDDNNSVDGITFTGNDPRFGALGWASRDSSKPGRKREDNKECWVLQSHPEAAAAILKEKKRTTNQIRTTAQEVLVRDFLKCLPLLAAGGGGDETNIDNMMEVPKVVAAIGHRWGAAFPIPSKDFTETESQLIASSNFVACGDYFGKYPGRIEGAYLSGISAADQLIASCGMK